MIDCMIMQNGCLELRLRDCRAEFAELVERYGMKPAFYVRRWSHIVAMAVSRLLMPGMQTRLLV